MAGGVMVLAESAWAARARAGVAALWLGLASIVIVLNPGTSGDLPSRVAVTPPPAHFLAISTGLVLLGVVLAGGAAVVALQGAGNRVERSGALLALIVVLTITIALMPLWRSAPAIEMVIAAAVILALSVGLARSAKVLHLDRGIRVADRWLGARREGTDGIRTAPTTGRRVLLLALFLVALIPTVPTLVLGTIVAAALLHHAAFLRGDLGRLPLLPILCLCLLPASWLILTVTGALAPPLWSLAAAPFSPAAELWIAPWLLVAVWGLLAQWPLHWLVPPPLLAILAGALTIGIGVIGIPLGLQAFQAWLAPIIVLSLWWSVAIQRADVTLGALALFGTLAAPEFHRWQLVLPFLGVSMMVLARDRIAPLRGVRLKIVLLLAGPGLWHGLVAGLGSQVVYTVLCVAAVAVAVSSIGERTPTNSGS